MDVDQIKDQNDEAIPIMLCCLVGILMIPLFFGWLVYNGYSTSLLLNPAVVSASNLTTSWDVTIDLGVWTTTGSGRVNIERVQAFLSHSASRHDGLVLSTQLFHITRPEMKHRNAYGIQLRAEDHGFDSSSLFGVSVQLWVRLVNRPWSNKYYFARLSCKPDWIRSLEAMRWLSRKENKCQVYFWDISVYLGILDEGIGCSVEYERVDAYLTRSASLSPTRQDGDLVASTLVFPMRQIGVKDCNLQGIQVRAEDAEAAEDRFDSSRVGVSVRVWARVVKLFFSERYYFVWISCNPDWIRFPDPIHRFSFEEKKCQVRIEQIKSDESWKTMHIMTSDNVTMRSMATRG